MNDFSTVFTVISSVISLTACLLVARCAVRVQALQDRLAVLPWSQLLSLAKQQDEIAEVLEELANRVKMIKVRNAVRHTDRNSTEEPDARKDPERWRIWKNAQLRAGEFNS